VKELIKAALSHNGIAVIDIISPCVTFNNQEGTVHSYTWGKDHEAPLHEISFIPPRDEIMVEDFEEGTIREVTMHDGSLVLLKKLDTDYDPTDRWQALRILEEAQRNNWLITGLLYINPDIPSLIDIYNLTDIPLNRLQPHQLRPELKKINEVNAMMF